jgi:broad specificity phosphatase PhoE
MSDTTLLIVRHPQTEANVARRFVGQAESALTAVGQVQARRLARKITAFKPEVVWTSPLERALTVARRAAGLARVPLRIDDRFIELDFGQAHGLTWDEIAEAGIEFNYRAGDQPVAPGGESRDELRARVSEAVDEVAREGGPQAIVCHAGVMRAVLGHTLRLSGDQLWAFNIHNAQLATVRLIDGHGQLEEFVKG